nr:hypothetical protein HK105_000346 [Polyrhizophydium stewartii]
MLQPDDGQQSEMRDADTRDAPRPRKAWLNRTTGPQQRKPRVAPASVPAEPRDESVLSIPFVSAFTLVTSPTPLAGSNVIKIGMNFQNDSFPVLIKEFTFSLQIWGEYLASTTDLLPGAVVQLIPLPGDSTASTSITKVLNGVDQGIVALIGSQYSYITKAASIIVSSRNIPHCDGASTSPDLSEKSVYSTFFRTIPSDSLQGRAIVEFILFQGWRRVAILNEAESYGTGLMNVIEGYGSNMGLRVESQQSFQLSGYTVKTDWDPLLLEIKRHRLFVIVLLGYSIDNLFERAAVYGMTGPEYVWVTSEAIYTSTPDGFPAGMITLFPTDGSGPAFDAFSNQWRSRAASIPDIYAVDGDAPAKYSSSYASCIDLILRGFDRYLRKNAGSMTLAQLASGNLTAGFPNFLEMFGGFNQTNLPVGRISINEDGDPTTGYDIYNLQAVSGKYVKVGTWESTNGNVSFTSPILFASGTAKVPLDDVDPSNFLRTVSARSWQGALAILLNMAMAAMLIYLVLVFAMRRCDNGLKSSWVESSLLVICGLMLACFDVFTMIGTPTAGSCVADVWIIAVSFSIVLSTINLRLMRVWAIVNGLSPLRFLLQRISLFVYVALSTLVQVLVLLSWTMRDPPQPTIVNVGPDMFQYICSSTNSDIQRRHLWALVTLNGLQLLACLILAVLSRHMRGELNEAKYIRIAVYSQTGVFILTAPVLIALSRSFDIQALFLIKQAAILMGIAGTTVSLFLHKSLIYGVKAPTRGSKGGLSGGSQGGSCASAPRIRGSHEILHNMASASMLPAASHSHNMLDMHDSVSVQGSDTCSTAAPQEYFVRFSGKYKESSNVVSMWTACEFTYYVAEHMLVFRLEQLSWDGKETKVVRDQGLSKLSALFVKEVKGLQVGQDMKEPMLMLRTKEDDIATIKLADHDKVTKLVDLIRQGIAEASRLASERADKKKLKRQSSRTQRSTKRPGSSPLASQPSGPSS